MCCEFLEEKHSIIIREKIMLSTNLGASPQLECWNNGMAARPPRPGLGTERAGRKGLMKRYQDQDIELIHQNRRGYH